MKTKLKLIAICPLLSAICLSASAQGTAFTYQGRLNDGINPASGKYDLTFALFSVSNGVGQVGVTLTNTPTAVSNGLFTVVLDFGANFLGADRWLEISVRTNGGSGFSTLSPRQQLTPTPYAIFANFASNLLGTLPATQLSGTMGNGQLANSSITVSAGTGLGGGGAVALGGSTTLNNAGVLSVTGNSDITANTVNGAVTLGDTATSADTANTIVKRDSGGSFSASSLTLVSNLYLPGPTASAGIIYAGGITLVQASGQNFFAGWAAGNLTMNGVWNTGIGFEALSFNTSGGLNTAIGQQALYNNTSGNYNTAEGYAALYYNTIGHDNTANGSSALINNTIGNYNTANGSSALFGNTNGNNNTASGYQALYGIRNGNNNTAIGYQALLGSRSGGNNTASGYQALANLGTGSGNIAIGVNAGSAIVTGNNDIDIGNAGFGDESDTIRIGTSQTKAVMLGIFGTTVGGGAAVQVNANGLLGTVTSSARFKKNIQSMDDASGVLLALKPVTFVYKPELDPEGTPQFGLIAEDVEKVDPALVLHDDRHQIYTVRYEAVNAMLLNEFLKEHHKVEEQSRKVEEQTSEIQNLNQRLEALEKFIHNQK
jgi:Chaperone of endosialidase